MKAQDLMKCLVAEFATATVEQNRAIMNADHRLGNEYAMRAIAAFAGLRGFGDDGRRALASLFQHPAREACVLAAAYLLRFCTDEAVAVLKAESAAGGMSGFQARQALARWSLDPDCPDQPQRDKKVLS